MKLVLRNKDEFFISLNVESNYWHAGRFVTASVTEPEADSKEKEEENDSI